MCSNAASSCHPGWRWAGTAQSIPGLPCSLPSSTLLTPHHSHSSPLSLLTTHTLHPVQASKPEDGLKCSECNQALPVAVVMNSLTLTIKAYMRQYYAVSVCVSVCECVGRGEGGGRGGMLCRISV